MSHNLTNTQPIDDGSTERSTSVRYTDRDREGSVNLTDDDQNQSTSNHQQTTDKGLTSSLIIAVLGAVSGTAFPFGYASGVLNAPQDVIQDFINETIVRRDASADVSEATVTLIFSLIVSVFALGGIFGGLFGGPITDKFGRRGGMFLNNIISCIACVLMFISKPLHSYEVLIAGRFLTGVACGYGSSVAPTYINEISPRNLRGTLGVTFQLGIVVVLFISQIVSLNSLLGSADKWNYALALPIVFSAVQMLMLIAMPESPKFLVVKGKIEHAKKELRRLRKSDNVEDELEEMQDEQSHAQTATLLQLFRTPTVRWALFITVFLQLSQQFSGINAVIYYSTTIFKSAGYSAKVAELANLGLGLTNIISTLVSVFLMDRLGRRVLHMTGLGGMFVTSLILAISLIVPSTSIWNTVSLVMVILFIAFFGIGPGAIPWLITAELFNQAFRVPASSVAVLVNWSGNFMVGLGFKPIFTGLLHQYTFLVFTGLLLVFLLLTFFFVPETKAKTIEAIYAEINAGQVWRSRNSPRQTVGGQNITRRVPYETITET